MQRRKAITTAASISLALFSAATAMAVNTGLLLSPPPSGVGELNAVSAEAIGPAPTFPPAPAQTIIVTVPRSVVSGAAPAASGAPSPAATSQHTSPAATSQHTPPTVTSQHTSPTVRWDDDEEDDDDEDDRPRTSTSRPAGGEDDD